MINYTSFRKLQFVPICSSLNVHPFLLGNLINLCWRLALGFCLNERLSLSTGQGRGFDTMVLSHWYQLEQIAGFGIKDDLKVRKFHYETP